MGYCRITKDTDRAAGLFREGLDSGKRYILSCSKEAPLYSLVVMEYGRANNWQGILGQEFNTDKSFYAEEVIARVLVKFYTKFFHRTEAEIKQMLLCNDIYAPFRQSGYIVEYYKDNFYVIAKVSALAESRQHKKLAQQLCSLGYGASFWEKGGKHRIYFNFATIKNWIELEYGECVTSGTEFSNQLKSLKVYYDLDTGMFEVQGDVACRDVIIIGMQVAIEEAKGTIN